MSPRGETILRLLGAGLRPKQIAAELGLHVGAVYREASVNGIKVTRWRWEQVRAVLAGGPSVSRDVGAALGLTRKAASSLLGCYERLGLIERCGRERRPGSEKPLTLWRLASPIGRDAASELRAAPHAVRRLPSLGVSSLDCRRLRAAAFSEV